MSTKKITKTTIIIIIIAILLISIFCIIKNYKDKIKIGSISTKNIVSFEITDIAGRHKNISDNTEREKIINLINSVKIIKKNVPYPTGDGYGVEITYSNGEKFYANFLESNVSYRNNDSPGTACSIDKNIVDDLRQYYDKN